MWNYGNIGGGIQASQRRPFKMIINPLITLWLHVCLLFRCNDVCINDTIKRVIDFFRLIKTLFNLYLYRKKITTFNK